MLNHEEETKKYVSFCGSYCGVCASFTGKKQNAARKALSTVEKRKSEFQKLFADEDIREGIVQVLTKQASSLCPGCKALVNNPKEAYICKIRQCCSGKNLDLCSECEDFPCETLVNHPTATGLHSVENLREIEGKGIESWLGRRWKEYIKSQESKTNRRFQADSRDQNKKRIDRDPPKSN